MKKREQTYSYRDADLPYWVAVSRLEFNPLKLHALMERFGSPEALWRAGQSELAGIDAALQARLMALRAEASPQAEMERLSAAGITALLPECEGYPHSLADIYDPPTPLYLRGDLPASDERAVAIVGSRRATMQGREIAARFARGLAEHDITIVSGLARGVDTAAHKGALSAGGRTIAVLGCGLDRDYPPENAGLAAQIAGNGAVLSEFCLGSPPLTWHFPQRNRIISGLSMATVVVEAGEKSGALITAYTALDQGREVMAVPGNIDNPLSRGPHHLIRQGAALVEDIRDIVEMLGMQLNLFEAAAGTSPEPLSESQKSLMDTLDYKPRCREEIIALAGGDAAAIVSDLTLLELKGYIRQLSGGNYVRNGRNR